jgi:hypothetical protein
LRNIWSLNWTFHLSLLNKIGQCCLYAVSIVNVKLPVLVQFPSQFAIEDQPELLCDLVSGVGVLNLDIMSSALQLSRPISHISLTNYPCVRVYVYVYMYVFFMHIQHVRTVCTYACMY